MQPDSVTQPSNKHATTLGVSGRLADFFQHSRMTPLLALIAFLLGAFAVLVTPREEEPQIDVTMANVMIAFPGASAANVVSMVATPAAHVLSGMRGVEHVSAHSQPGMALLTVQFEVGVARHDAIIELNDALSSHADWLPQGLGVSAPIVKPKGIDDVPIVALTLHGKNGDVSPYDLERIAHSLESELKRISGTRDVYTIGTHSRAINIAIEPARLAASGITLHELAQVLQSANQGLPLGHLLEANQSIAIEAGAHLENAAQVAALLVGVYNGKPVYLREIAQVSDGSPPPVQHVWHGERDGKQTPAVTIAITKKSGENAIQVANAIIERTEQLKNVIIPDNINVSVTRNYGKTANDKATQLISKLLFATLSVVGLIFITLGRREAAIVGVAVMLTLTVTLFASWAWGFTLNRVSLFALIFSIGILVDDAIVVVENIHRHQHLHPEKTLSQIIPGAVDEVGSPTILATLTVIAALLPMAFVSGLMGPYMAPIPINASMGMLLSLAIAFSVTPWLARLWLNKNVASHADEPRSSPLARFFERIFKPLVDPNSGRRSRLLLLFGIVVLIVFSVSLPLAGAVILKMLPFDNKSELQIIVDMPTGSTLEKTAALLHELGAEIAQLPELDHYQAYAGSSAPINFNGLVRQYDLRNAPNSGDIQVNLVDKSERKAQSHAIARRIRAPLQAIGQRYEANVKIVEVPPGPPVMAPIVAEVYGPDREGQRVLAQKIRAAFNATAGVVDVDDSSNANAARIELHIDRQKAALLGVPYANIITTLQAALSGLNATWLHDESRFPVPVRLQLAANLHGSLTELLQLTVRSTNGSAITIAELIEPEQSLREQPIHQKDLLPVTYITADTAGQTDSPLYGMFAIRSAISEITAPDGGAIEEYFINQPADPYRGYALKWDGEWQITYETFRDMGLAYAVGLILIYLLVVAQSGSYGIPLIIMIPIPLTIIGVMPGHALLGAQFTATSMIGMIALAGIIVRNSILLVDFIQLQQRQGVTLERAVVRAAITRAQPILLTGLAAMIGAFFILDDPIFNGLAIALIFGILVSSVLTLVVIPTLYYATHAARKQSSAINDSPQPLT